MEREVQLSWCGTLKNSKKQYIAPKLNNQTQNRDQ